MTLFAETSGNFVVDQLLHEWDLGRNSALFEMNAPGSVTASYIKSEDGSPKPAPNSIRRERFKRLPFADEIKFEDALIECISFGNRQARLKISAVDRSTYWAAWDEYVAEGLNPQFYLEQSSKDFIVKLDNPNYQVRLREDVEAEYSQAVGKPVKFSGAVDGLYRPKKRWAHLIQEGVAPLIGGPSSSTKLTVPAAEGFYFLRGWFNGDREARCWMPKSYVSATTDETEANG